MKNELYIERSKVRGILIGSNVNNEDTKDLLQEIDALPIFTAGDFSGVAQCALEPHETTYLRGWNEGIERAAELLDDEGSSIPADKIRTLLEASAVTSTERSDKLPLDIESTKEDYARAVLGPTLPSTECGDK